MGRMQSHTYLQLLKLIFCLNGCSAFSNFFQRLDHLWRKPMFILIYPSSSHLSHGPSSSLPNANTSPPHRIPFTIFTATSQSLRFPSVYASLSLSPPSSVAPPPSPSRCSSYCRPLVLLVSATFHAKPTVLVAKKLYWGLQS
ncbi:hypothetical protein Fmac_010370 [Flemingia macrophylla]|uniref:Uncharacterized protein n=1 Tax=Flemingia macrophylla TaxID=520843 RepID=A0ABD1MJE1_9FABA